MSFDPIIDNNFLQVKASKIRIRSTKIRINLVVNIIIAVDMDKGIGQNVWPWKPALWNVPTSTETFTKTLLLVKFCFRDWTPGCSRGLSSLHQVLDRAHQKSGGVGVARNWKMPPTGAPWEWAARGACWNGVAHRNWSTQKREGQADILKVDLEVTGQWGWWATSRHAGKLCWRMDKIAWGPARTTSKLGPARVEQRRRHDRKVGGDAPNALAGLIGSLEEKFSKWCPFNFFFSTTSFSESLGVQSSLFVINFPKGWFLIFLSMKQ